MRMHSMRRVWIWETWWRRAASRAAPPPPPLPPSGRTWASLPMGFGLLVNPDGSLRSATVGTRASAETAFEDSLRGPDGLRVFLVTFSDPRGTPGVPPDARVEDAHV